MPLIAGGDCLESFLAKLTGFVMELDKVWNYVSLKLVRRTFSDKIYEVLL